MLLKLGYSNKQTIRTLLQVRECSDYFHVVGVTGFRTYRSGMPHGIPDLVEHAYRSLNSSLYRQARSRFSSLSPQPNEKGRLSAVPFHLVGVTGFRTYRSGMPHGIPDLVEHAYRSLNSSLYRQARSRFSSLSPQPNEKGRLSAVPFHLVGVTGFEPATSWTRTMRTTKLCHTPICNPIFNFPGIEPATSWPETVSSETRAHTKLCHTPKSTVSLYHDQYYLSRHFLENSQIHIIPSNKLTNSRPLLSA